MNRSELMVPVSDLLHRPGSQRWVAREAVIDGLVVLDARVPDGEPVAIEARLDAVNSGIVATGKVNAPWEGVCRRCLAPVGGTLSAEVLEVFEASPTEGETRPLEIDRIDLEPVAREAVLLELPLAPLCREDCAGLCPSCGQDLNLGPCHCPPAEPDPRWAALDQLRFDD